MKPLLIIAVCLCVIGAVWQLMDQPTPPAATPPPPAEKVAVVPEKLPTPMIDEVAPEVKLTTGRVLYNVLAKSFTQTAVSVSHRDGLQIVPYEQFPVEYRTALVEMKPAPQLKDPKEEARRAAAAHEKERKKAELEREREAANQARESEERRNAANAEMNNSIHEGTAKSYAYSHFKTKYDPTGSGTGYITNLSVNVGAAEEMSGWEGRCRTKGSASFRLYESAGGSMNQASRTFEVITEYKGGTCRVIDFSVM